jgi:hypothetical protein
MCEAIEDFDDLSKLGQGFTSADPLEGVDIGDGTVSRPTFVNKNLDPLFKSDLIKLLKEYIDCFEWNYNEIPDLSRNLVEHHLRIKPGFRPYKQPRRNFNLDIYERVKEEVSRLLDAKFIRLCRYADWISNIVPVEKKGTKKLRVCIDFRDLNRATPKDEYPMPIADFLLMLHLDIEFLAFLMVMLVTIKYLWSMRIYPKRLSYVRVSLACLSGLS